MSKNKKVVIKNSNSQLSKEDKQRLERSIAKAKRDGKFPTTAQNTIPYKVMYRNGMCQLAGYSFSKTIEFEDINYELLDPEDKEGVFNKLSDLYNYFTEDMHVQMTYANTRISKAEIKKALTIQPRGDENDELREELTEILMDKEQNGNKGIRKYKYLTYTIEEDNPKLAAKKMENYDAAIMDIFKKSGLKAPCHVMSGTERLRSLHSIMHPEGREKFKFNWSALSKEGLSTKDFIVPMSFSFPTNGKYFRMGDIYGCVSLLSLDCPRVDDRIITDLLSLETPIVVTLHLEPIDRDKAKKYIQKRNMQLNASKIREQTHASQEGYDIDILPPELTANGDDTEMMLQEINSSNENLFNITILVCCFADKLQDLWTTNSKIEKIANKQSCQIRPLRDQQEQAFVSSLPLGVNQIEIQRTIMTSQLAMLNPFISVKLFSPNASYYGVNPLTKDIILADRTALKNPNGLYLGIPGGGKSFAGKREKLMYFLRNDTCNIMVIDPEDEYQASMELIGGQVVDLSASSSQYINPMDINFDVGFKDEDPIKMKCQFMLSIAEQIASPKVEGVRMGLEGDEISIVDEVSLKIYEDLEQEYWIKQHRNPTNEEMPTLEDFYNGLRAHSNPKAQRIADCFQIYITGTLNVFNHHTNVDLDNRVVCFNIKRLTANLREVALVILTNFIWNRVSLNRNLSKKTLLDIDEFHLMLRDPQTAAYFVEFWKRFRKWGGIPTGLTQNITDLLKSSQVEQIFQNSEFIYMLPQSKRDKDILEQALNISDAELEFVTDTDSGEGIMKFGNKIVPFKDEFPKGKIYRVLTTKPEEVEAMNG